MGLAYNTGTEKASTTSTSGPITFSHDNLGDGVIKVSASFIRGNSLGVEATCTYDGVSMIEAVHQNHTSAANSPEVYVWVLEGSWSGAKNVSISLVRTANSHAIEAIPVSGYKAGDLLGSATSGAEIGTGIFSRTITTDTDGSDVIMIVGQRRCTGVLTASGTDTIEISDVESDPGSSDNGDIHLGVYKETQPIAGATTIDAVSTTSQRAVFAAFELQAAAVVGVTPPIFDHHNRMLPA